MSKGVLIAVEGGDKAGKHTQIVKIIDFLKSRSIECETLDFPRYKEFFGVMCKEFLNGNFGDPKNVPPEYIMLPYALDRLQAQPIIRKWLDADKFVVLDRYTYSNLFQAARFPKEFWSEKIDFLEKLEFKQLGLVKPNYNIYLAFDPRLAYEMRHTGLKEYQGGKPDINESNYELQSDVADVYRMAAAKNTETWTVIEEMTQQGDRLSIDEVFAKIQPKLDEIIVRWK